MLKIKINEGIVRTFRYVTGTNQKQQYERRGIRDFPKETFSKPFLAIIGDGGGKYGGEQEKVFVFHKIQTGQVIVNGVSRQGKHRTIIINGVKQID